MEALNGAAFASMEDRLSALLERGLGLAPTAANLAAFAEQCRHRAAGLDISEAAYYDLLAAGGPSARTEWLALSPALTVGETFLFRDAGLWRLIERKLLPELARLTRPLWLWSAGCSTGEEAYTLAIVARKALAQYEFSVLGSDVNPKAIAAARIGTYTQWSLRGVEHSELGDVIVSGTQTVRVRDDIKRHVRFETHNLLDDEAYPPPGLTSFECIICRNVLIYMTPPARAKIVANLAACLTPGGVLILGHGEATGVPLAGLSAERHDAGVIYRKPPAYAEILGESRPQGRQQHRHKAEPPHGHRGTRKTSGAKTGRANAGKATGEKHSANKFAPATRTPAQKGANEFAQATSALAQARSLLAVAVAHARAGQMEAAERSAALAMAANPLDPDPHVLLAALYAARDAFKQAEAALRRALFLDPACIPALWQLGTLYRMTERDRQAALAFARLLARLEGLPPDQEALPFDKISVNELTTLLRAALGETAHA
jgi:chemotaxis protein methyltransferase CheR